MKTQHRILVTCGALMLTSAFAATQGTLGATSQGSFTNTFNGTTAPQVQILGLSDAVMTPASGQVAQYEGAGDPGMIYGVADQFCVVNTSGGAVLLSVTADQYGGDNQMAIATAAGGSQLQYLLLMHVVNNASINAEFDATRTTWTVPAAAMVSSAAACGAGNVRKVMSHYFIDDDTPKGTPFPANGNVYVGTVTITATPQ